MLIFGVDLFAESDEARSFVAGQRPLNLVGEGRWQVPPPALRAHDRNAIYEFFYTQMFPTDGSRCGSCTISICIN